MDISQDLQSLLEHGKIRDCIIRLARGEDRRNATLITASCGRIRSPIMGHGL
jgi:hypothetical protein